MSDQATSINGDCASICIDIAVQGQCCASVNVGAPGSCQDRSQSDVVAAVHENCSRVNGSCRRDILPGPHVGGAIGANRVRGVNPTGVGAQRDVVGVVQATKCRVAGDVVVGSHDDVVVDRVDWASKCDIQTFDRGVATAGDGVHEVDVVVTGDSNRSTAIQHGCCVNRAACV